MDIADEGARRKAEELLTEEAERALNLFEDTRDEAASKCAEERVVVAAEHAADVIEQSIQDEGGTPTHLDIHEMADLNKIIDAEQKAEKFADKNDLFFEDRKVIRGEELAADAQEREAEARGEGRHHHSRPHRTKKPKGERS